MTTIQDVPVFERILQHLHQTRGFDFTAYTRSSLLRRVSKRMQAVHAPTFEAYLEYLQDHQEEGAALFDTVVVHVTSFFRDPEVWQHFSERIAPDLIASAGDGGIRVWCAGCASGEEPYTVAMLLAERLGVDGVRRRVKIYATDVDAAALTAARRAVYSTRAAADVPAPFLEKYFDRIGSRYAFDRHLRRALIFEWHDLVRDAPVSNVDLLVCRNTLMYFTAAARAQMLSRFHQSMSPAGYLLLGRAEMLFSHAAAFVPADLKHRIFRRVPGCHRHDRVPSLARRERDVMPSHASDHDITGLRALQVELHQSKRELARAYEELQSTIEALETTNDTLQSTVEELETTNEALVSQRFVGRAIPLRGPAADRR